MNFRLVPLSALLLLTPVLGQAQTDPQREIEELREQNRIIMQRLDATAEMLESAGADTGKGGRTTIGGYGELHYNHLDDQTAGGTNKRELDFHRFVLFFGHRFSDRLRFHSELELEHALVEDTADGSGPGEVELEQAYIEYDLDGDTTLRGGLFLIPVGIINETHEPPTFYGTERNAVEKNIIPATWWEGGVGATLRTASGLTWDLALHSGLATSAGASYKIRSGRQKVAKASANALAWTARLKWTGVPGLELAATVQRQNDITQGADPTAGAATLIETHAIWQSGPFGLRALYATWDLDGSGPAGIGADEQSGWYIEPSYKVTPTVGVFARASQWDNAAGDNADSVYDQIDVGLNYWPHPDVVIKLDYQDQSVPAGKAELDGFNLGIGYQF